ncbi:MAG: DUF4252 domain-containing protein [Bacteroidaceae bacterium]
MRKFYLILALLMSALTSSAQTSYEGKMEFDIPEVGITASLLSAKAHASLADALGEIEGIESVYISKDMLTMAGGKGGKMPLAIGGLDKLQCIYYFYADDEGLAKKVKKVAKSYMKSHKYEKIMEQKEGNEMMNIHKKEVDKGLREFVLLTSEETETSVIIYIGNISFDDLKNMKVVK